MDNWVLILFSILLGAIFIVSLNILSLLLFQKLLPKSNGRNRKNDSEEMKNTNLQNNANFESAQVNPNESVSKKSSSEEETFKPSPEIKNQPKIRSETAKSEKPQTIKETNERDLKECDSNSKDSKSQLRSYKSSSDLQTQTPLPNCNAENAKNGVKQISNQNRPNCSKLEPTPATPHQSFSKTNANEEELFVPFSENKQPPTVSSEMAESEKNQGTNETDGDGNKVIRDSKSSNDNTSQSSCTEFASDLQKPKLPPKHNDGKAESDKKEVKNINAPTNAKIESTQENPNGLVSKTSSSGEEFFASSSENVPQPMAGSETAESENHKIITGTDQKRSKELFGFESNDCKPQSYYTDFTSDSDKKKLQSKSKVGNEKNGVEKTDNKNVPNDTKCTSAQKILNELASKSSTIEEKTFVSFPENKPQPSVNSKMADSEEQKATNETEISTTTNPAFDLSDNGQKESQRFPTESVYKSKEKRRSVTITKLTTNNKRTMISETKKKALKVSTRRKDFHNKDFKISEQIDNSSETSASNSEKQHFPQSTSGDLHSKNTRCVHYERRYSENVRPASWISSLSVEYILMQEESSSIADLSYETQDITRSPMPSTQDSNEVFKPLQDQHRFANGNDSCDSIPECMFHEQYYVKMLGFPQTRTAKQNSYQHFNNENDVMSNHQTLCQTEIPLCCNADVSGYVGVAGCLLDFKKNTFSSLVNMQLASRYPKQIALAEGLLIAEEFCCSVAEGVAPQKSFCVTMYTCYTKPLQHQNLIVEVQNFKDNGQKWETISKSDDALETNFLNIVINKFGRFRCLIPNSECEKLAKNVISVSYLLHGSCPTHHTIVWCVFDNMRHLQAQLWTDVGPHSMYERIIGQKTILLEYGSGMRLHARGENQFEKVFYITKKAMWETFLYKKFAFAVPKSAQKKSKVTFTITDRDTNAAVLQDTVVELWNDNSLTSKCVKVPQDVCVLHDTPSKATKSSTASLSTWFSTRKSPSMQKVHKQLNRTDGWDAAPTVSASGHAHLITSDSDEESYYHRTEKRKTFKLIRKKIKRVFSKPPSPQ